MDRIKIEVPGTSQSLEFGVKSSKMSILADKRKWRKMTGQMHLINPSFLSNQWGEAHLDALSEVSQRIPVIFPVHPRTLKRMEDFELEESVSFMNGEDEHFATPGPGRIYIVPPQGYLNFLALTANARLVLTDSGGIQAETTYLGIPCLTLRENTEWLITLERGTNKLVGIDPERIKAKALKILRSDFTRRKRPTFWDGSAASRIAWILAASA